MRFDQLYDPFTGAALSPLWVPIGSPTVGAGKLSIGNTLWAFTGVTRGISRGVAAVGHTTLVVLGYGTVVAAAVGVRAVQGWRDHLAVGA